MCTETTAVWFLGLEFKPRCRFLCDPREEFQSSLTSKFAGTQTLCYFCSSESSRGTNFTDVHQKFKSFHGSRWRAPYERTNLTSHLHSGFSSVFVEDFSDYLHVCYTWRGNRVLIYFNPIFEPRNSLRSLCYSNGIIIVSSLEDFLHFWCSVFEFKANLTHCPFKSVIIQLRIPLNTHKNNHQLRYVVE